MSNCPKCHQPVKFQAITCPYCRTVLKAYGHPGMTLHRADKGTYLCESCTYHHDDTCNFPQRPHAMECTLYQNLFQAKFNPEYPTNYSWDKKLKIWCQGHQSLLMLSGLVIVSLIIALFSLSK